MKDVHDSCDTVVGVEALKLMYRTRVCYLVRRDGGRLAAAVRAGICPQISEKAKTIN